MEWQRELLIHSFMKSANDYTFNKNNTYILAYYTVGPNTRVVYKAIYVA